MNVLMAGYFGRGNLGDEAIKISVAAAIRSGGGVPLVLTADPDNESHGIGIRKNLFGILSGILQSKVIVIGGGGLLIANWRPILLYSLLAITASLLGRKVIIASVGVEPITNWWQRRLLAIALRRSDFVSVRDYGALDALRQIDSRTNISVTGDAVWLSPSELFSSNATVESPSLYQSQNIESDTSVENQRLTIGVSLLAIPHDKRFEDLALKLPKALDALIDEFDAHLTFYSMYNEECDKEFITLIQQQMNNKQHTSLVEVTSPTDVTSKISRHCINIGMRLHFLILSALTNTPIIAISRAPKVDGFLQFFNRRPVSGLNDFAPENLSKEVRRILTDPETEKRNISHTTDTLREYASTCRTKIHESLAISTTN